MENKIERIESKLDLIEKSTSETLNILKKDIRRLQDDMREVNGVIREFIDNKIEAFKKEVYRELQRIQSDLNKKIISNKENLEIEIKHETTSLKSEINIYKNIVNQELDKIKSLKEDEKNNETDLSGELNEVKNDISILTKKVKKLEILSSDLKDFLD